MATIKRFEDLEVWKLSRNLATKIYKLSERLGNDYGLQNQIRKAVISISSNIAEGFERDGKKEFIQFLFIAKGSAGELRSQMYILLDLNYISQDDFKEIITELETISKMIKGFISYLKESELNGLKFKEPETIYGKLPEI
jgi:four helix bundle protein